MDDLRDNEIIGLILSISGAKSAGMLVNGKQLWNWNGTTWEGFNALYDDALCFQLMVKYQIELNCYNDEEGHPMYWVCAHGVHNNNYDSPNKAICLAIIEAHNG